MSRIPVGVSQCLLGEPVRYDGGHKHFRYLTQVLARYMDFRPVCPEVAIGLGIPRKPIRLVTTDRGDRILGLANPGQANVGQDILERHKPGLPELPEWDVTEPLRQQADIALAAMPDICGYVFMQNSPSCGVFGLKRYSPDGRLLDTQGQGAYAARLIERMPLLPVEEAGRLNDPALRENFITRVFACYDWQQSVAQNPDAAALLDFYSRYKYQIMAHHPASYQALGKLLADLKGKDISALAHTFFAHFMHALSHHAGRKGNTNTLMHLRGYLKDFLSADDKQELSELIECYRLGEVPLVVPLTLLKHYLKKIDNPYLSRQSFWAPYPEKLGLRNLTFDE